MHLAARVKLIVYYGRVVQVLAITLRITSVILYRIYPFPYTRPLVAYSPLTLASLRMLPCRTHWPRPSTCIMYGCGTACGTTLFARFGPITLCPKPPKIDFWPTLSPYAT